MQTRRHPSHLRRQGRAQAARLPLFGLLLAGWLAGCAAEPPPEPGLAGLIAANRAHPDQALAAMRTIGERIAGAHFIAGNHVQLLINGTASFAALRAAIDSAKHRIDMESYEFDDDAGGSFAASLLRARQRGVSVHLIYDGWGTIATGSALFDRLRQGGIETVDYNPLLPGIRLPFDINRRDHRKLFIADGRVVITGGVNISSVYKNAAGTRASDPNDQAWRDTDVRIEGPVAPEFERDFVKTWRHQHGSPLPPLPPTPAGFPDGLAVQAVDGAPHSGQPLIYRTLLAVIALSQKSVHLTTGFFAPTPGLLHALEAAARRGVDVRIILPGRSTSEAALAAGRSHYGALLGAGVRIREFHGRILHAKTAVIDGAWSAVGSSNLDWRSTIWNNEIDAIVLGPDFGAAMENLFQIDQGNSTEITLRAWEARGLVERLNEAGAGLVAPLL